MKTKELIDALQKLNPNSEVVIKKDIWGFSKIKELKKIKTKPYMHQNSCLIEETYKTLSFQKWQTEYLVETNRKTKTIDTIILE